MGQDQDRYLRTKLADDSAHLVKENALLSQQVLELQKQAERVSQGRPGGIYSLIHSKFVQRNVFYNKADIVFKMCTYSAFITPEALSKFHATKK